MKRTAFLSTTIALAAMPTIDATANPAPIHSVRIAHVADEIVTRIALTPEAVDAQATLRATITDRTRVAEIAHAVAQIDRHATPTDAGADMRWTIRLLDTTGVVIEMLAVDRFGRFVIRDGHTFSAAAATLIALLRR